MLCWSTRVLLAKTLICLLLNLCSAAQSPRIVERSALLRFKSSQLGVLSLWSGEDTCSWPGVMCDSRSRVVALNITAGGELKLGGEIAAEIGDLTELRVLSVPFHSLAGEIPAGIWRLQKLEVLNLEGNLVSGYLPLRFVRSLRVLNLASNRLAGEIPHSLSACLDLEVLDLSNNKFNGTIPGIFGDFHKLETLDLSFNQFTGSIPNEFGAGRESLVHIHLSRNFLLGGIPRNLGNSSKFQTLLLLSDLLDDVVPSEIGKLTKLRPLDVSRNSLCRFIPPELGNCQAMSVLVLSSPYNPMPPLDDPGSNDIDDCNYFQGGIPDNITSLSKLWVLWAPRATLEGEIPSIWGELRELRDG